MRTPIISLIIFLLLPFIAVSKEPINITGTWRADAQFHLTVGTERNQAAHAVIPLTLNIDKTGKVTGASPKNGCQLLGLAEPGSLPHLLSMDITLSGCRFTQYNERYKGSFSYFAKERYTKLWLRANRNMRGEPPVAAEIKSTMRR